MPAFFEPPNSCSISWMNLRLTRGCYQSTHWYKFQWLSLISYNGIWNSRTWLDLLTVWDFLQLDLVNVKLCEISWEFAGYGQILFFVIHSWNLLSIQNDSIVLRTKILGSFAKSVVYTSDSVPLCVCFRWEPRGVDDRGLDFPSMCHFVGVNYISIV